MQQWFSEPPALNEIELSVFGPGYGEAIALHLGGGKWLLVDSCRDPDSDLPASLQYLLRMGVDVAHDVKLIVVSHWHDDHIRGISGLYNACQGAELAIPSVLRTGEFRKLVSIYGNPSVEPRSGVDEFTKVFELLEARRKNTNQGASVKLAVADKLLWRNEFSTGGDAIPVSVYALSPSDRALLLAQRALAEQVPGAHSERINLLPPSPNFASVALWVEIGTTRLLLGADVEHTRLPSTGWTAIITESKAIVGKSSAFKVPHHGAQSGHHDLVWTNLLTDTPFAVVTPFRNGRHLLPTPADVDRIGALTPYAYLTAPAHVKRTHWRRRMVRDFVEVSTRSIEPVYAGWGQVQLRRNIEDGDGDWRVRLFGDAYNFSPKR